MAMAMLDASTSLSSQLYIVSGRTPAQPQVHHLLGSFSLKRSGSSCTHPCRLDAPPLAQHNLAIATSTLHRFLSYISPISNVDVVCLMSSVAKLQGLG